MAGPGRLSSAPTLLLADLGCIEQSPDAGDAAEVLEHRVVPPGPPRGRVVPLQHRAARPAGEHHEARRRPCTRCGARGSGTQATRPRCAANAWREWLVAELARPLTAGTQPPVTCRRDGRRRSACSGWCGAARADRPGGVRRLRAQHDPLGERRARRVPAGQGGRAVRRPGRGGALLASDRSAVRDHRRPAARARDHAGAARDPGRASRSVAGAGRRAGSHDRLFRLQQGRRIPHVELGAVQGADRS